MPDTPAELQTPEAALQMLWQAAGLPTDSLPQARLPGREPVLPSSFAVGTAAQAALAAGALAAAEVGRQRGGPLQQVTVDMRHAALECCTHFLIDGQPLQLWDKLAGLYPCGDDAGSAGWVRIHTNFAHHPTAHCACWACPKGPAPKRPTSGRRCAAGTRSTSSRPRPMRGWWSPRCAASTNGTGMRRVWSSPGSRCCSVSGWAMRRRAPGPRCCPAPGRCTACACWT